MNKINLLIIMICGILILVLLSDINEKPQSVLPIKAPMNTIEPLKLSLIENEVSKALPDTYSFPILEETNHPTIEETLPSNIVESTKVLGYRYTDTEIMSYVRESSSRSGYDINMLQGLILQESEWDPNLVDNQDYGLCQINKMNFKMLRLAFKSKYPEFNILNYKVNIDSCIYILDMFEQELKDNLGRDPSIDELLTAYNRGVYYASSRGTSSYSQVVKKNIEKYKKLNGGN